MEPEERSRRVTIVIEQCGGIMPMFEALYIQSILHAANAANDAIVVSAVQEALTHAAGLSRFFWPARQKHNELALARAARLREAFQMNGSPLEDRDLRNALEHFDERLDEFLLGDVAGVILPGPLVDSHALADDPLGRVFRLVDPDAMVFVILGEKHTFQPIWDEVRRLLGRAHGFDRKGGMLRE